jgi:hypothetical protein
MEERVKKGWWMTRIRRNPDQTITLDFSTAQGDRIDIRDLLVGYDPLTSAVADFVQIVNAGAHSSLSVDRDGAGASYGWTQVATLENVTGLTDEALLVANGKLVVA